MSIADEIRQKLIDAGRIIEAQGQGDLTRGHISVLDRKGLERRTCECYAVVKKEYDRLLPAQISH